MTIVSTIDIVSIIAIGCTIAIVSIIAIVFIYRSAVVSMYDHIMLHIVCYCL